MFDKLDAGFLLFPEFYVPVAARRYDEIGSVRSAIAEMWCARGFFFLLLLCHFYVRYDVPVHVADFVHLCRRQSVQIRLFELENCVAKSSSGGMEAFSRCLLRTLRFFRFAFLWSGHRADNVVVVAVVVCG